MTDAIIYPPLHLWYKAAAKTGNTSLPFDLGQDKATARYGYHSFAAILKCRSLSYIVQGRSSFIYSWWPLTRHRQTLSLRRPPSQLLKWDHRMATASYPNWVFTLFSGIGFLLCCIPFPWHLKGEYSPLRLVPRPNLWCLSLEYGNMPLHGLDMPRLPWTLHKFYHMEG